MKTLKLILVLCTILAAIVVVFFIIEAHKKTHGYSPQLYKCDRCTAVFNSKGDLKAHRRVAPQFKCEECTRIKGEKVYWHTMALLERHMLEAHGNEGTFKCPYCDKEFVTESAMESHVNTTHLKFACDKCPDQHMREVHPVNSEN